MAKKKSPMMKIFLVFFVVEVALVLISGSFTKELKIGFENGKFSIKNTKTEFNLQEKITEDFQIDEFNKEHEETKEIYGSAKLYRFFEKLANIKVFGDVATVGTFQLLRMLLIVDILLLFIALFIRKYLAGRPSKSQLIFEMIYTMLEDFVRETLGKDKVYYTPYIVTLFIFIWVCNMVGMIPIPGFMEPTRNLNVPLGLGFMAVIIVHASAVKFKGAWKHIQAYMPHKNPLFILDLVGEVSKVVSISFRLFGNILGGAIIILVVSSLVSFVVFPVGLTLFFGLFVGTIQAFVFTMLALTYIGVEISE